MIKLVGNNGTLIRIRKDINDDHVLLHNVFSRPECAGTIGNFLKKTIENEKWNYVLIKMPLHSIKDYRASKNYHQKIGSIGRNFEVSHITRYVHKIHIYFKYIKGEKCEQLYEDNYEPCLYNLCPNTLRYRGITISRKKENDKTFVHIDAFDGPAAIKKVPEKFGDFLVIPLNILQEDLLEIDLLNAAFKRFMLDRVQCINGYRKFIFRL